jgi:ribosomal protein S27AE
VSDVHAPLGRCPRCDESIPRGGLLIEYETDDGPRKYAECPGCGTVVHPG